MTLNPFVPESWAPKTSVAGNRYSPPRSTTAISAVIEPFTVRTTLRAFSRVRNGWVRVPGLPSFPDGETYKVVTAPGGGGVGGGGVGEPDISDTITVTGTTTSDSPLALRVKAAKCVPAGSPRIPGEGVRIVDEPETHVPNEHPGLAS